MQHSESNSRIIWLTRVFLTFAVGEVVEVSSNFFFWVILKPRVVAFLSQNYGPEEAFGIDYSAHQISTAETKFLAETKNENLQYI